MQKALLGADRTIAFGDARQIRGDAKAHAPAVAAAFVGVLCHPARASGGDGWGISIFHSLAASIQETMASCTFFSASSGVSPSDMQPGKSGTVARQPPPSVSARRSMRTAYSR